MPTLNLVVEERFAAREGRVYSRSGIGLSYWERYLGRFSTLRIHARIREERDIPGGAVLLNHPRIDFAPLPYFVGPRQLVRVLPAVVRSLKNVAESEGALLLRGPGLLSSLMVPSLRSSGRRYGMEVVGNPQDVFGVFGIGGRSRALLRCGFSATLRSLCRNAEVTCYVTERALQSSFPPCSTKPTFSISDVDLPESAFVSQIDLRQTDQPSLLAVGTLEQPYKGFDILIKAVAALRSEGLRASVTIVGEGRLRPDLEILACSLGLAHVLRFTGLLARREVLAEMDRADLFVLPSLTEGMPRVLLEAMARGKPVIASDVGGVPELLAAEDLVRPGRVGELAGAIRRLVLDRQLATEQACRNLAVSRRFASDSIDARRLSFLGELRERTCLETR